MILRDFLVNGTMVTETSANETICTVRRLGAEMQCSRQWHVMRGPEETEKPVGEPARSRRGHGVTVAVQLVWKGAWRPRR